jgi:hypothetical protein
MAPEADAQQLTAALLALGELLPPDATPFQIVLVRACARARARARGCAAR